MKLAIVGSRSIHNYELVKSIIDCVKNIDYVYSGGADGVDTLAEKYCQDNNIPYSTYYPNWKLFGRGAGVIRNSRIVDDCDKLIAIWDGKSRGTLDSITKAIEARKLLFVYNVSTGEFCFHED